LLFGKDCQSNGEAAIGGDMYRFGEALQGVV